MWDRDLEDLEMLEVHLDSLRSIGGGDEGEWLNRVVTKAKGI